MNDVSPVETTISPNAVERLAEVLKERSEMVVATPSVTTPRLRDIKGTYLLRVAKTDSADLLVTRDRDLIAV